MTQCMPQRQEAVPRMYCWTLLQALRYRYAQRAQTLCLHACKTHCVHANEQ
jgi:hypothetical protein